MEDGVKLYRVLVICFTIILLIVGIYIGFKINEKETSIATEVSKNLENENNKNNSENTEVNIYENKKDVVDVELVYEDVYTLCNDPVITLKTVHDTTVEEVKSEEIAKQKKEENEYEVEEETDKKIVFKKINKGYCPGNYEVIIENSKVNIYTLIDENKKELYEETDIEEDWIREELQDELKKGIVVKSKEELNILIEDLES